MARAVHLHSREIQEQLDKLINFDPIAQKMLDESIGILGDSVKKKLKGHKVSGELEKSIKSKKSRSGKDGRRYALVSFDGYEKGSAQSEEYPRGKPNAIKAVALEYGTSDQAATPFMISAINDAHDGIADKMQEVLNRETGNV